MKLSPLRSMPNSSTPDAIGPGDPRWLERLIDFAEQTEDRLAELNLRLPHGDFDNDDVAMVDDARFVITQLIAALAPARAAAGAVRP